VWICKGEVYGKRDLSTTVGSGTPNKGGKPSGGGGRGGRRKSNA
jgi:hypothetical protein